MANDYSLLSHEPSTGADDCFSHLLFETDDSAVTGFAGLQVSSIFGPGQTDYVLANFRATLSWCGWPAETNTTPRW
jgi:hypothetical protein